MNKRIVSAFFLTLALVGCRCKEKAVDEPQQIQTESLYRTSNYEVLSEDTTHTLEFPTELSWYRYKWLKMQPAPTIHCVLYYDSVGDYNVVVDWYPWGTEVYMNGPARIHFFIGDNYQFSLLNSNDFVEPILAEDSCIIRNGRSIRVRYRDSIECDLFSDAPFYFRDVDFDGEQELLITHFGCAHRGGHVVDVYDMVNGKPVLKTNPPFDDLETHLAGVDTIAHTYTCVHSYSGFEAAWLTYKIKGDLPPVLIHYDTLYYDNETKTSKTVRMK